MSATPPALLSVLVLVSSCRNPPSLPEAWKKARASTCEVLIEYEPSTSGIGVDRTDDSSLGTCVVWREEWVVTARHVVSSTKDVVIIDSTGTQYEPDILIRDPAADVAVLHVPGLKAPPVSLARGKTEVGQTVFAAGLAGGFKVSMAVGVVSSLHLMDTNGLDDSIQIDAQINAGNSGGGVFDANGDFIALANQSLAKSEKTPGISWAVDLALVEYSANQMIEKGSVTYAQPLYDINFRPCRGTAKQLERFMLSGGPSCVLVTGDSAPLKKGDQILEVRGVEIESQAQMKRLVFQGPPGEPIPVMVSRMGERMNLDIQTMPAVAQRAE